MAENGALRAENQYQKKKRACKTGSIQKGRFKAVDDAQEAMRERRVGEQLDNNDEDDEPVLASWPPRRAAEMVLPKCSECVKIGHTFGFCSL